MNACRKIICVVTVAVPLVFPGGFAAASEEPLVAFTHVPPYGSTEHLAGCVENVEFAAHAVAVYIFVGGWWTKPTFAAPLSAIGPDGTWSCHITTGGSDAYATQIAAYLVPLTYAPPLAEGWPQLPDALDANAVASVRATRPYTRRIWTNMAWATDGVLTLAASAEPQVTCRVEASANLTARAETAVITPTNPGLKFTEAALPGYSRRFYRLTALDP